MKFSKLLGFFNERQKLYETFNIKAFEKYAVLSVSSHDGL